VLLDCARALTDYAGANCSLPAAAISASAAHAQRVSTQLCMHLCLTPQLLASYAAELRAILGADITIKHDGVRDWHMTDFSPSARQGWQALAACACDACMAGNYGGCCMEVVRASLEPLHLVQVPAEQAAAVAAESKQRRIVEEREAKRHRILATTQAAQAVAGCCGRVTRHKGQKFPSHERD
jgi:hypothetical protein